MMLLSILYSIFKFIFITASLFFSIHALYTSTIKYDNLKIKQEEALNDMYYEVVELRGKLELLEEEVRNGRRY